MFIALMKQKLTFPELQFVEYQVRFVFNAGRTRKKENNASIKEVVAICSIRRDQSEMGNVGHNRLSTMHPLVRYTST